MHISNTPLLMQGSQHDEPVSHSFETIVVGGGQAGLAMGYELARLGQHFLILNAQDHIGASWRKRWDSLRLFTSAAHDALPGLPFPAPPKSYPTKDAMADYLESYAAHFALPVRGNTRVEHLARQGDRFVLTAGEHHFEAGRVIVAMNISQSPKIPPFASQLAPTITHLHSSAYRNPDQLPQAETLVVGAGNSGAEIALELAQRWSGKRIWLAGRDPGYLPLLNDPVSWWVFSHVLSVRTPFGRALQARKRAHGTPLGRLKPADLVAAGIERVPRVIGVKDGKPVLEGGRVLDCATVIWCTGFAPNFDWIHVPVFGAGGYPIHERGVVPNEPGLFFLGAAISLRFYLRFCRRRRQRCPLSCQAAPDTSSKGRAADALVDRQGEAARRRRTPRMIVVLSILLGLAGLLLGLALVWFLLIAAIDRFVLRHLALQPGMRVADVGCGDGRLSLRMAKLVGPSGTVLGVDMRPWRIRRAIHQAQTKGFQHVQFTHAIVGEGALPPLSVDRAVLVTVLGEMAEKPAALGELFQALKPGGIVGITEVVVDPHYQPRQRVRMLAEAAGFQVHACPGNWLSFMMLVKKPENRSAPVLPAGC